MSVTLYREGYANSAPHMLSVTVSHLGMGIPSHSAICAEREVLTAINPLPDPLVDGYQ